ncbi:MAG: hypothetical protein COA53_02330 [Rhodobacteraceae bacterium]|nr:MAG: hypothetical protein COA53_02330 [Paracoccaceae bacterium]
MQSHIQFTPKQRRKGASLVLSIVLSVIVLLAQSIPAMSTQNTGTWIEICGDDGISIIQVDENGNKQQSECAHCDYCLLPSGNLQGVSVISPNISAPIEFTAVSYSSDQAISPDSPEQYWSACRGPPIASTEKNMSTFTSLVLKEPIREALNTWGNPCI